MSETGVKIKRTRPEKCIRTYIFVRFYGEFNNPKTSFFRRAMCALPSFRN